MATTGICIVSQVASVVEESKLPSKNSSLCRNCGNTGHNFCKMIFSDEQRVAIKENIRVQVESRRALKEKNIRIQSESHKAQRQQAVCKNCAEFGHRSCKKAFDELEKIRIADLYRFRCTQGNVQLKLNAKLPPIVCRNCGELGHSYCKRTFNDMEKVEVEEVKAVRRKERAEKIMKIKREYIAERRRDPAYQEQELAYKQTESYRLSCARSNAKKSKLVKLLKSVSEQTRIDPQRPEALIPLEEFNRVAAEYDFTKHVLFCLCIKA